MSILVSFIISLATYNLHYLNCTNMFNIIASKSINDSETAKYMNIYIDKFGCNANIALKTKKLRYEPKFIRSCLPREKTNDIKFIARQGHKAKCEVGFFYRNRFFIFL